MAAGKKIEKSEPMVTGSKPVRLDNLAENSVVPGKDGKPSDSTASVSLSNAASLNKGEAGQESVGEHGLYYPHPGGYNYYYQGYSGTFGHSDGYLPDGSYSGMQSDDGSVIYYVPGYNSYTSGDFVGIDGQYVGEQQFSSGYLQPPVSYGAEALPYYAWDPTFVGDATAGNMNGFGAKKTGGSQVATANSNIMGATKMNDNVGNKPLKPFVQSQPLKPFNKVPPTGPNFSAGNMKGFYSAGKYSAFTNQRQGPFQQYGLMNYRSSGRTWVTNYKFRPRDRVNRNGDFEVSAELTRGPRSYGNSAASASTAEKVDWGLTDRKDQYNQTDFQVNYEAAKFHVIKSYSEDDVHKCIKYNVWTSTPNGNKKLDAAFHDAERQSSESGKRCPVFLFFSVNGSGQFVGCAEMIGQVDFNKNMDFWQLDKWSGFFPVKWHIVKDVPNVQLRHIVLDNIENRPVTYTRDTQEIGLRQGLEMLKIFKNYMSKTSLLDDFSFYENREKSREVKGTNKPAASQSGANRSFTVPKSFKGGEMKPEQESAGAKPESDPESLLVLTKNLSLDASPLKSTAVKSPLKGTAVKIESPTPA